VKITDVKVGTGPAAKKGDEVSVHYTGKFKDGKVFDSSKDGGDPLNFTLGAGKVIKGFDIGITGMKVGGIRKIVIPPELGYGDRKVGPIPPNSELHFEIELVKVQ